MQELPRRVVFRINIQTDLRELVMVLVPQGVYDVDRAVVGQEAADRRGKGGDILRGAPTAAINRIQRA